MATADARDIMGLGNDVPRVPAPKKKKHAESQHRMSGMSREVYALMGDSVPPIPIVEAPKYKSRPSVASRAFKPRRWDQRPFVHGAREDNLTLKHWKRSIPGSDVRRPVETNGDVLDVEMQDENKDPGGEPELRYEDELPSERWNVKVQVPSYTDEQYEAKLATEDWTRQETDYLMDLCRTFDLRWVVIADRYEPAEIPFTEANANEMAIDGEDIFKRASYHSRSMEDLKSRYYTVAAKMLETQIPASNMTQSEFQLWEKMRNFDAKTETMRKALAEKLFERTKDEADEERILLEELKRITNNEDEFLKMRRDLYARLEPPPTKRGGGEEQSTAMYQTSSGLGALLQNLLAKEKRLKRPSVMPNGDGTPTSATDDRNSQKWEKGRHPNQYTRRDTMDTQDGDPGPQKKGSQSQQNIRTLTPGEEAKFGVSYPTERLTSGVAFRHEKASKVLQAKSSVQATKILGALTELGIPARLGMPTERVCREFERLVNVIHLLLDTRKGVEKVSTEVKVLEEARRIRLGLPKEGEGQKEKTGDAMEVDRDNNAAKIVANPEAASSLEESKNENVEHHQNANEDENEEEEDDEDNTAKVDKDDEEENEDNDEEDDEEAENDDSAVQAKADDSDEEEEDADDRPGIPEVDSDDEARDVQSSPVASDEGDVRLGSDADDDEEEEEEQEEEQQEEVDDDEEIDVEEGADVGVDSDAEADEDAESANEDEADEEEEEEEVDEDEDAEEASEATSEARPPSSQSALTRLKRSASVVSEVSKAGSNRSGLGRKKRR